MNALRIAIIGFAVVGLVATAQAAKPEGKAGPHGHIYGTVVTDNGHEYTGVMRWGTEEGFWDDLFNSTKDDLPYLEEHRDEARRRNRVKVFGITVGYRWDDSYGSRMFIARFGDIQEIRALRGEKIKVTMKEGTVYSMEGGSNDVGADVTVFDTSLGEVKLDWDKIDRITFASTPGDVNPPGKRLYGKLTTDEETFEGYIQWDVQESMYGDKLDGETDDGDLSIDMGRIASIEKYSRKASRVEMKDGRKFILEGTNDVDDSNRGIHVEDPRFGRVKVSWEAFEKVEFREVAQTGRGYDDYLPGKRLTGSVIDYDDKTHSGGMVFDLDEMFGWELLNGDRNDVEYYVPFSKIRSIEPQRDDRSEVILRDGTRVILGDGQDVSESNDGVVILRENGRETYIGWDEVKKVEFD